MININVNTSGEITISQETAGERIVMSDHYNGREVGPDGDPMGDEERETETETERDQRNAAFFKSGWDTAIRETQLQYVNGRIEEFWNEQGYQESVDPHHNEPEGTGYSPDVNGMEEDPAPVLAVITDDPDIHPAEGSGEPELEENMNKTWDPTNSGTWTMSNEELQSRLDETYNRGRRDGLGDKRQTTRRSLQIIANETDRKLWPEGTGTLSRGGVFGMFAVALAERLGFEVTE